jgi:hypothetical protein
MLVNLFITTQSVLHAVLFKLRSFPSHNYQSSIIFSFFILEFVLKIRLYSIEIMMQICKGVRAQ